MKRPWKKSCFAIVLALAVCGAGAWSAHAEGPSPTDGGGPAKSQSAPGQGSQETPEENAQIEGAQKDDPEPNDDIMKQFTRHRPGGCPEGPPCKFED